MEYEVEGSRPRGRPKTTWKEVVREDCRARKLNKEDAVNRCKWRKVIKEVCWPGWVWAGKCFFWYRPTRVVPDKRPLNGCCCYSTDAYASTLTLLVGRQQDCLERRTDCLHMVQLMPVHHKTPSSLALFKSWLALPFWYRFIQADLEKRPINRYSSSSVILMVQIVILSCWKRGQRLADSKHCELETCRQLTGEAR